jgi:hypothetical protein
MPIEHDAIPTGPTQPVVFATNVEGAPENVERALGLMHGHLLAAYRGQPGWQGAIGLKSFDGRRTLVLNFWESASALQENIAAIARVRERAGALGVTITDTERFEIHFDERVE